jgi:hypothetical protein
MTTATRQQLVAALKARTKRTRTTWQASDDLTLDEWKAAGPSLGIESRASGWWLGDWVRFGAKHYGLSVAEAAQITGYEEQTLYNMVSIAAKFPVSRRRENLSWSHHVDVAALPGDQQDGWLDRAVSERMSVQELRKALRRARRAPRTPVSPSPESPAASSRTRATVRIVCSHCGGALEIDAALLRKLVEQLPS